MNSTSKQYKTRNWLSRIAFIILPIFNDISTKASELLKVPYLYAGGGLEKLKRVHQ